VLVPGALGIALMCAVESLAAGRALASADDPPVDPNHELIALGVANLGAGVFQAYPSGGGLSQSAVNDQAGARTQLAEIVTVGVVVLVLTLLTDVLEDLADATLAALVIVAAAGLIKPAAFRRLARIRSRDFGLALVALGGVLAFGILDGVLIAIAASIVTLAYQTNHRALEVLGEDPASGRLRTIARHPEAEPIPGLVIVRPRGALTFANIHRVRSEVLAAVDRAEPPARVLLWDDEALTDIEITAIEELAKIATELHQRGCDTWIAAAVSDQQAMLERFGLPPTVRTFDTVEQSVEAFRDSE
jgi:MFS superfamily sulfate permease-like transporter